MRRTSMIPSGFGERGATLVFFALFLLFLLGSAALAVDLGMLYVARSEAQRTADAAALAGANIFTQGCGNNSPSTCGSSTVETQAANAAITAAKANQVLQQPGSIDCAGQSSSWSYSSTGCAGIQFSDGSGGSWTEPQITVTVQRTGIPLIFAKMFGNNVAQVEAQAVAEADTQAGLIQCPNPFLIPNCDPNPNNNTNPSGTCNGVGTFVTETSTSPVVSIPSNPEQYSPSGSAPGVYGEPWTLHYAYPTQEGSNNSVVPSQWAMVDFGSSNSLNTLAGAITACAPDLGCGSQVGLHSGNNPQPIDSAVTSLIQHVSCAGYSPCGTEGQPATWPNAQSPYTQDYLQNMTQVPSTANYGAGDYYPSSNGSCPAGQFPFVTGGWNSGSGTVLCSAPGLSASIITAPVYNGAPLCSGNSCGGTVTVVGWVVLFINYSAVTSGTETVQANILNVIGCGAASSTSKVAASTVPIRLIQSAN